MFASVKGGAGKLTSQPEPQGRRDSTEQRETEYVCVARMWRKMLERKIGRKPSEPLFQLYSF